MSPTLLINLLALGFVVTGLGWLAVQVRQTRRQASVAAANEQIANATLDCLPGGYFAWFDDGQIYASPGLVDVIPGPSRTDFESLKGQFSPDDRGEIDRLINALRKRGESFSVILTTEDGGRAIRMDGRRARGAPLDVMWARDATDEASRRSESSVLIELAERETGALKDMLNALPIPVWRRGDDLGVESYNKALLRALNTDEGAAARTLELGGSSRQSKAQDLAALALSSGTEQVENGHLVVGGQRRLLQFHEVPTGGGTLVGFALDYSQLEDAQTDLSRHIAAHADVLENLAVAIAIYNAATRLTFYNTAYAHLWESDTKWLDSEPTLDEELEHLRERRRLPEYVDFRAFKADQQRLFTSLMSPVEDLVHLPDGRTLRKRVSPHPFGGLLFTYEDVTDSLTLERSYNTLIEVQRRTLDNLYEGVALIGADGRLKLCNPAYARLWQFSDADLLGEPHIAGLVDKCRGLFATTEDWETRREQIIDRLTAREPRSGRMKRADGSVLEYATVPLPDGMVLLSYIDVTDRYKVEHALRERTEALEAADQLKTEFIANVSYELRTPLNAIIGFAEILGGDMFGELNERQTEYCAAILQSSQTLLELINDILDLATIEAGYMELELEQFDIREMLNAVHTLARERARQSKLRFELDCAADIGTMVGDERRLKQVMFHLVSNAIKFTPPGGAIGLRTWKEDGTVSFAIGDTGVGIPEDRQESVLEKFEHGGQTMTRQMGAGAGLGLSLVKSFIELHGGTVDLLSEPESGTTVTCRVPVSPAHEDAEVRAAAS